VFYRTYASLVDGRVGVKTPTYYVNLGAGATKVFLTREARAGSNPSETSSATVTPPIILEVKPIIALIWPFTLVMPRLRKSRLPTDISAPTPTPPAELVQNLTTQRDFRALAASSTAVAFSIGSPIYEPDDTFSDGAAIQERDTAWQTTYAAIKMAIEITKESSDMFLPLKAVVGAMSVLIKNYDVGVSCSCTNTSSPFPVSRASKHRITRRT
jgi:hypothetical protein